MLSVIFVPVEWVEAVFWVVWPVFWRFVLLRDWVYRVFRCVDGLLLAVYRLLRLVDGVSQCVDKVGGCVYLLFNRVHYIKTVGNRSYRRLRRIKVVLRLMDATLLRMDPARNRRDALGWAMDALP